MESKKLSKLPEGVGKRIIETLRNQDLDTEYNEVIETEIEMPEQDYSEEAEEEQTSEEYENYSVEEEDNSQYEIEDEDESEVDVQPEQNFNQISDINYSTPVQPSLPKENKNYSKKVLTQEQENNNSEVSDIDTLLNLISKLPSGVTKQTGALIIRQTMEAMGISMNNVLSNAQSVQEELEYNIRNNINVIEEYRTKIKILEKEIHKFRKKSHELEDIISLFILSEDKN